MTVTDTHKSRRETVRITYPHCRLLRSPLLFLHGSYRVMILTLLRFDALLTMLKNKPRAGVTKKQATLMPDQPLPSKPTNICHCSSLFTSPNFRFFTSKITPFDSDFSLLSPTSILDANSSIFSSKIPKPTSYFDPTFPNPQRFHSPDSFGLACLVNCDESSTDLSRKPVNKMILFGSKLRVLIPCTDFGTKTMRYPGHVQGQLSPCVQTKVLTGASISHHSESEDYTRVISHGPNPTITHIFDNSIFVETSPCSLPLPKLAMETKNFNKDLFLSYCYTCKKSLVPKQDIYIYRCRGDKGFCSSECRYQEMLLNQMET